MKNNKTVVISCAGMGTRLQMNIPKCLVMIEGKSIIERQLEQLKDIKNIIVVVGYKKNDVVQHVKNIRNDIIFCENSNYEKTGTGASFIMGANLAKTPYVFALDGDMLIHPHDIKRLLETEGEFACGEKITTEQPMLMSTDNEGMVTGFSREKGNLEWSGIACLKKENIIDDAWHVCDIVNACLPMKSFEIRAKEVDTPSDLDEAKRWIRNSYDDPSYKIDEFFKSRFFIKDNYVASRYSYNTRNEYDAKLIKEYINSDSTVLDLGCGTGILEGELYKYVKKIVAVEKYQEFIKRAPKFNNVEYINKNMIDFYYNELFNCVLLFGITMYLSDEEIKVLLNNILKMLEADGTIIIKNQWGLDEELVVDKYSQDLQCAYYAKYRHLDDMINILSDYNLNVEINDIYPPELNKWNDTHEYALVCKRKLHE